jgi:cell division protein FtsB
VAVLGRRATWLAPATALVTAGALLLLDGDTGLGSLLEISRRVERAEERLAAARAERARLVREVKALRSDPYELEVIAREQLGMVRPGEIVLRWEPAEPAAAD